MVRGYSVIIPVWKEHEGINGTIRHIRHLGGDADVEIIVVDGDPAKSTLHAIGDSEVKRVPSARGRGRQMNAGAASAGGSVLLFLHADTRLPVGAFDRIGELLHDTTCVGGFFDLGIDSERSVYRFIEVVASKRSRITNIPYGDQAIFLRKEYFDRIGGYHDLPIMEDVDLMRRIKRQGDKLRSVGGKVITSSRRWEKEGILLCTVRNWLLIVLYFAGVSPRRLAIYYR